MGAALVSFAPVPLPATQVQSIPVNIVTDTATSEMTRGQTTAPKEAKNPFAEKNDVPSPVANPNAKIAPKEVSASTDATPPPSPPEPKQEAKQKAEPKRDLIAEALKKDAAKQAEQKKADAKKADAKIPTPPKRPPQPNQNQPKFDPREMQALLDKRDPQRKEATGTTLSDTPSIGTAKGTAPKLTQNEMDALRRHLYDLWNPSIGGLKNPKEIIVVIRFQLNPDGTLAGPPRVLNSGQSPQFMAARDAAIRAVFRGQPFKMLRPETYENWKDLEITFDPVVLENG